MSDLLDFFTEQPVGGGYVWATVAGSTESLAYRAESSGSELAFRPRPAIATSVLLTHARQGSGRVRLDDPSLGTVRLAANPPYPPSVFYKPQSPILAQRGRVGTVQMDVLGAYVYEGEAGCGPNPITLLFGELAQLEAVPLRITVARILRASLPDDPSFYVAAKSSRPFVRDRITDELIELIVTQHFDAVGGRVGRNAVEAGSAYKASCRVAEEIGLSRQWDLVL